MEPPVYATSEHGNRLCRGRARSTPSFSAVLQLCWTGPCLLPPRRPQPSDSFFASSAHSTDASRLAAGARRAACSSEPALFVPRQPHPTILISRAPPPSVATAAPTNSRCPSASEEDSSLLPSASAAPRHSPDALIALNAVARVQPCSPAQPLPCVGGRLVLVDEFLCRSAPQL